MSKIHNRPINVFEFAYWLQGCLEISGTTSFTDKQTRMIKHKLEQIPGFRAAHHILLGNLNLKAVETRNLSHSQALTLQENRRKIPQDMKYPIQIWLTLTLLDKNRAFEEINKAQQQIFIHDIDPTYDGDQNYFHAIHNGEIEPD